MKRSVCLKEGVQTGGEPAPGAPEKRAGHLLARMRELDGFGVAVRDDPETGETLVRFTARDNAQAAAWLEEKRRIAVTYDPAEDWLVMRATPWVSFEDIDYVQGAVMELLG